MTGGSAKQGLRGSYFADIGTEQGQTFRRRCLYFALAIISRAAVGETLHNRNRFGIPDLLIRFQDCERESVVHAAQFRRQQAGTEQHIKCMTIVWRQQVGVGSL